jgi:hypothetical protein
LTSTLLNGCETLLLLVILQTEKLMNDRLKMSSQMIYEDLPNVISLPESDAGRTRFDCLGGLTIAQFGQALVPANLSARQAKALGLLTSGIYGPLGIISSASAALSLSLANRLKLRSDILGLTLFKLTWKMSATPLGRRVYLLRGSAPRTSVAASTLWESKGWPTPNASLISAKSNIVWPKKSEKDPQVGLADVAAMSLGTWSTPTTPSGGQKPPEGTSATGRTPDGKKVQVTLQNVALMLGTWVTPSARDWKDTPGMATTGMDPDGTTRQRIDQLPRQAAQMDFGQMPTGCPSVTGKSARLNPALSRWLMGLPPEWDACAPMVTRSSRKSPKPSSNPI